MVLSGPITCGASVLSCGECASLAKLAHRAPPSPTARSAVDHVASAPRARTTAASSRGVARTYPAMVQRQQAVSEVVAEDRQQVEVEA